MTSVTKVLFSIKNRNVYTCTQQITLFTLYTSQILRFLRQKLALINLNIKSRTILIASISNKALLNLRINADPFTKVIPAGYGQFRKLNRVEIEQKIQLYTYRIDLHQQRTRGVRAPRPPYACHLRGGGSINITSYPSLPFKALSDQVLH